MRTAIKETQVFSFDELPEEAKDNGRGQGGIEDEQT